jgi:hypothetical protein
MLTREQVIEVFFASAYRTRKAAEVEADRILTHLARRHYLYRWYPPTAWPRTLRTPSASFRKSVFYFSGRAMQPWAEVAEKGPCWPENFVGLARQVGLPVLQHDVACSQMVVDIVRSLRERQGLVRLHEGTPEALEAEPLLCSLQPANWYGSRQIRFVFYDARRRCDVDMKPDGFASLAVERTAFQEGASGPGQLPFFYEFDRGTKEEIEVAQQMLDYHRLAVSGKVGERFPELAVSGYAAPMIMLFPDRKRLGSVVRAFGRQAAKAGFDLGAPILVGVASEWAEDPFTASLTHAWDGRTFTLLDALLAASRRLREQGILLPRHILSYSYTPPVRRELRRPLDISGIDPVILRDDEHDVVEEPDEVWRDEPENASIDTSWIAELPEAEGEKEPAPPDDEVDVLVSPPDDVEPEHEPAAPKRRRAADTGWGELLGN